MEIRLRIIKYVYIYICFKTFFYVVRHLDSIASYLPTGLHLDLVNLQQLKGAFH